MLDNNNLPLWALIYTVAGAVYITLLIIASCFFTNRANSPPEKRVLTVAAWVVSISLAILGLVHFSASFDQGLLTVTKMVLTVTIHMVVFGAQLSIVWYYVWAEHVELTLYQKMKRTLIPTTAMALAYGIAEAIVVGLFWSTTVLKRGIGALTIFWLCIRILWTLIYTTAITVGLIHPRSWKLPSPSALDIHFFIMLFIQMVGIVGRLGAHIYSDTSSFGCIAATSFLVEYLAFVPLIFGCATWMFRANRPVQHQIQTVPHRTPGGDSDFGLLSSDYDTDRY